MSVEVRRRGIVALTRELGPVGAIRFLQQFENGIGDYTQDRHDWLPGGIDAIVEKIERQWFGASRP